MKWKKYYNYAGHDKNIWINQKNFPINEAVDPNAIKTKEKPRVKKIVLTTIRFLSFSLMLSNDIPEI